MPRNYLGVVTWYWIGIKTRKDKANSLVHWSSPQAALIKDLNPIIRGWANYYSNSDIKRVGEISNQDNLTYLKLRRWAKRRCLTSSAGHQKYWHSEGSRNWVFSTGTDANSFRLQLHRDVSCSSTDYVKVKGDKSPYDGDLVYWSSRMGRHPELPNREAKLLRQQKGRCTHCGLTFREGDVMEVDHIIPNSIGGKDEWKNLQLLHRHCHDVKTASDGSTKSVVTKS
jgi:RNA-directed DNA polymerase